MALRRLLFDHRILSAWVIALALLMKIVVPAGFMPVVAAGAITVELCSGAGPMTMTMPGMAHHPDKSGHAGKETPCGFAALSTASLGGADAALIADTIAYIVATVWRGAPVAVGGPPAFLRPPPRAPPARS